MHLHRESQEELPAMSRMQLQAGLKYGESPLLGPFSGWGVRRNLHGFLVTFACTLAFYASPLVAHLQKIHNCVSYEMLQQDLADVLADNSLAVVAGDFNASAPGTCMEDFSDLLDTSL